MKIDYNDLLVVLPHTIQYHKVHFTTLDVSGAKDDLELLVLDIAAQLNLKASEHENQRLELVQPGRIDLHSLANFLSSLPGNDDSNID